MQYTQDAHWREITDTQHSSMLFFSLCTVHSLTCCARTTVTFELLMLLMDDNRKNTQTQLHSLISSMTTVLSIATCTTNLLHVSNTASFLGRTAQSNSHTLGLWVQVRFHWTVWQCVVDTWWDWVGEMWHKQLCVSEQKKSYTLTLSRVNYFFF